MFRAPAIQQAARLLINRHRAEAHRIAVQRAVNLGNQGAKLASLKWLQVAMAVRVIEKDRPKLFVVR
jgi:hypothetical protein